MYISMKESRFSRDPDVFVSTTIEIIRGRHRDVGEVGYEPSCKDTHGHNENLVYIDF